jgi:hypothetical protein
MRAPAPVSFDGVIGARPTDGVVANAWQIRGTGEFDLA